MLLKEVYNQKFLKNLADAIVKIDKNFAVKKFLEIEKKKNWADLALKQRMRAVTLALDESLSAENYEEKILVLRKAIVEVSKDKNSGLALIVFPDFVEVFGIAEIVTKNSCHSHSSQRHSNFTLCHSRESGNPEQSKQLDSRFRGNDKEKNRNDKEVEIFALSMQALEFFTQFGTSEFAVRQFIKHDQKAALKFFTKWAKDKNHHIRRLASEGLRPKLPWGEVLMEFRKNPAAILPILEEIKNDESEYVRKSISNNLNDISKDHPQLVLDLMKSWSGKVPERLIKHGLRTLLKSGDKEALEIIGIKTDPKINQNFSIKIFDLKKRKIKIGQNIEFDFVLQNKASAQDIRLEYAVYFLLKNGKQSKKIFQITTKNFPQGLFEFSKKHSFKIMTTRKYNCGEHAISLVINGVEVEKREFCLL